MENSELLKIVADNQALFDALKKKLQSKFTLRSTPHKGVDDTLLGQTIRARLVGHELVEEVFQEILRLREGHTQPRVNHAR